MNASLGKHFVSGIPVTILSGSRAAGEVRGWLSLEPRAAWDSPAAGVTIDGSFECVSAVRATWHR